MNAPPSAAETSEHPAIQQTAMDYIQGWYDGNQVRMERSLHSQLAKRAIRYDSQTGQETFNDLEKIHMVDDTTPDGGGTQTPREKLYYKVVVLDVYEKIATVRVESYNWIEYLHMAKSEGRWVIVNALYTTNLSSK